MDVPPCNPLLDLWFVAMVLSKTLNGSSEVKKVEGIFRKKLNKRPATIVPALETIKKF